MQKVIGMFDWKFVGTLAFCCLILNPAWGADQAKQTRPAAVLDRDNLVAWCIVPFDAARRGPEARAQMLNDLGIKRCAYDWRQEHIPTFEQEILQYKKHGIEFFAFWSVQEDAFQLFKKYDLHPQIWQTLADPGGASQQEKVEAAAQAMVPLAKRTKEMGCKLGLYNHGGWGGEPKNLIAVCQRLHALGYPHVGIVYNLHHGHGHIKDWDESLQAMLPWLHCLNLNGMNANADPKIMGIGKGPFELSMIRSIQESGYEGPIGILDHRNELDAKDSLQENLEGVEWVQRELLKPGSGGPKPKTPKAKRVVPAKALSGTTTNPGTTVAVLPPNIQYGEAPLTVQVQATLHRKDQYNILVACNTKSYAGHWEMFSMNGSGNLTVYIPGASPDHVHTKKQICDGKPHRLAMVYEPQRVRLYVDGEIVADQNIRRTVGIPPVASPLGIGRLVERDHRCSGPIEWIHIASEVQTVSSVDAPPPLVDEATIAFWKREGGSVEVPQKSGPPSNADKSQSQYDPKRVDALLAMAKSNGDPLRGARMFADAKTACLSCHQVGERGGTVGPELTEIVKVRKPSQLVEAVLWPDREVLPEYVAWTFLTVDGEVIKGYKVAETEQAITVRDPATAIEVTIDVQDIEDEVPGSTVMPIGLTSAMTEAQQADLIAFLLKLNEVGFAASPEIQQAMRQSQHHGPAGFAYDRAPLDPDRWPHASAHVNRDRIYDFYTKQAEHFRQSAQTPILLASAPGLDGGDQGHWGNQDEQTWASDAWNKVILEDFQLGIFRHQKQTIPRAVCVRLGAEQNYSVCFNPDTLSYEAFWKDGFVSFSAHRHGFLDGIRLQGTPLELAVKPKPEQPFEYHGFYRVGKQVVFSYRIGETDYLDSPAVIDGEFVPEVSPVEQHSLRDRIGKAEVRSRQVVTTKIIPGTEPSFAIDTIELPIENPWQIPLFCSGHDFASDGSGFVCTIHGDVWHVSGLETGVEEEGAARWSRFASGLNHPQGVVVVDDVVYVQCRDQLVRLADANDDGQADFYECFSNAFETSAAGHDFICGLQRDVDGFFYTASGNQGIVQISPDGKDAKVVATGFRNPDGIGILSDGSLTVPCSEGSWTPASMVCRVPKESFGSPLHFGYGGPKNSQPPALPLAYLPRLLDNSSGGQVEVPAGTWDQWEGSLLHLSFGTGTWFTLLQDVVDGQSQGAAVPMAGDFLSGVHRARFSSADGHLYVSGCQGWGSYTIHDGCFQRVRLVDSNVQSPIAFHLHENGIQVRFTQPVDAAVVDAIKNHFAQVWNYRYSGAYGSPEYSTTHPGVEGHDPLEIRSAHVLSDGRSVFLEIPELQPVNQLHLRMIVNSEDAFPVGGPAGQGHDLFVTVHTLDAPFEDFEGYQPTEKTIASHPILTDLEWNAERVPNPWSKKIAGAREIELQTDKNLTYATPEFEVQAGEPIALNFLNPDVVPHNWVLVQPGKLATVGGLANQLIADPKAFARQYIPRSEDVLRYTDVVSPGAQKTIWFTAPEVPGTYPFLCTFPGHWMVMNGKLIVRPAGQ